VKGGIEGGRGEQKEETPNYKNPRVEKEGKEGKKPRTQN
jgi:GTPase involved in cell partitioning and DNA repair